MDYCLSNYVQQLSDTLASRLSDLNKRIAALESKSTIVCTTPVLSLINYDVDIPRGAVIHYHDINITYSQDAERLWNFVWGGTVGSGTRGQYDAIFTFNSDCKVPNGLDNEVTISQLNFKSPNGSTDEYFQGVLIVNNVNLSFSYNPQLVSYTWDPFSDPSKAIFTMSFDLQSLGPNWKTIVNWNNENDEDPAPSPVANSNSIYANLYLKDSSNSYLYWDFKTTYPGIPYIYNDSFKWTYYYLKNMNLGIFNILVATYGSNPLIYLSNYTNKQSKFQIINGYASTTVTTVPTYYIYLYIKEDNPFENSYYYTYYGALETRIGTLQNNNGSNFLTNVTYCNGVVIDFSTNITYISGNFLQFNYTVSMTDNQITSAELNIYVSNTTTIYFYFTNIEQGVNLNITNNFDLTGTMPTFNLYIFGLTNKTSPDTVNNPNSFFNTEISFNSNITGKFDSTGNFST
jgi:hypothetical protein